MEQGGPTGHGGAGAEVRERLRRVEEHCGFTEHTVEQLSAEMVELGRRVAELGRRVEGLERRLGELGATEEGPKTGEADAGGDEGAAAGI